MSDLALNRDWILEPDLLRLVHVCRRLIREEFGIKLHLDIPDLQRQLAHFAGQTRSRPLQLTWERLARRLPEEQLREISEKASLKVYRGHQIYDDASESRQSPNSNDKLTYRGQKVIKEEVQPREARKWERMYRGQYVD